eukprot:gene10394-3198_t
MVCQGMPPGVLELATRSWTRGHTPYIYLYILRSFCFLYPNLRTRRGHPHPKRRATLRSETVEAITSPGQLSQASRRLVHGVGPLLPQQTHAQPCLTSRAPPASRRVRP